MGTARPNSPHKREPPPRSVPGDQPITSPREADNLPRRPTQIGRVTASVGCWGVLRPLAHNYFLLLSSCLQMDFARMRYMQDYGKVHYTYSKDYLSGAFILVDPVKQAKKEKKESTAKWLTKEGFQWPKARTPKEINSLPEKLPSASYPVAESEFVENQWNQLIDNRLPKVELTEGRKNFNIRYSSQARPFDTRKEFLKSVFACEAGATLEEQERKTQTYQAWLNRLAVDDKRFHILWNRSYHPLNLAPNLIVTFSLQSASWRSVSGAGKGTVRSMTTDGCVAAARDRSIDKSPCSRACPPRWRSRRFHTPRAFKSVWRIPPLCLPATRY
jgi:hypothetical protein